MYVLAIHTAAVPVSVGVRTWPEGLLLRQQSQVLNVIVDFAGDALLQVLIVFVCRQVEAVDLSSRLVWRLSPAYLVCVLVGEGVRVLLGLAQDELIVGAVAEVLLLGVSLTLHQNPTAAVVLV